MTTPESLLFSPEHEWVRREGNNQVAIGISDHAQSELGDVVFVELPEIGTPIRAGDELGAVESVKAVSEIYAPVSGEVIAVNETLEDSPEFINEDPYQAGWIARIRLTHPQELETLMSLSVYRTFLGEASGH